MFGVDEMLTGGLSLLGGVANNLFAGKRQDDAQAFNAQQAAVNREWQERMSNTSYQRAAADMEAAGLNRILAVGHGASTPGGSSASSSPGAPVHDMLGPAVNTAMAKTRLNQEIENMKATEHNTLADTRKKISEGNLTDAEEQKVKDENAIIVQNLSEAQLRAARSKIDREQLDTPAMKVLRQTGNIGAEAARASSAIGNIPSLINAGRGRVRPEDFEETTYHPRGETTIKEKKFKRR